MKDSEWWMNEGGFFGQRYIEGDDSVEGYLPDKKENLKDRTERESEGVINLLKLPIGSSILDVPCGYGRHSIYLAKKGFQVTGIDINEEHLKKAIISANNEKVDVSFKKEDMKFLGKEHVSKYDSLINIFYSFGFFTEEENIQTMKGFYNSLKNGGKMLIHTDVSPEMISNKTTQTDIIRKLPNGNKLVIIEHFNSKNKRMQGSWEITDNIGSPIHKRAYYSVRIYSKEEFEQMAKKVGFKEVKIYGSFQGEEFNEKSKEMIIVAQK